MSSCHTKRMLPASTLKCFGRDDDFRNILLCGWSPTSIDEAAAAGLQPKPGFYQEIAIEILVKYLNRDSERIPRTAYIGGTAGYASIKVR